jgi:hypothetical protein
LGGWVRSCQIWRHHNILIFKVISQIKTTVKKFPSSGLSVLVMNYLKLFDIPIFKHKRNRTLHFLQRGARCRARRLQLPWV